jgi:thiamine monophosphate synthase
MLPRLHLITDDAVLQDPGFLQWALDVLRDLGPAIALHLRGHATAGVRLYRLATALAPAAQQTGSLLVINDRVDLALFLAAEHPRLNLAVQLGRRSLPLAAVRNLMHVARSADESQAQDASTSYGTGSGQRSAPREAAVRQIGYSAHSETEAAGAERQGADFLLVGPIHATASHPSTTPAGIKWLGQITKTIAVPVIAIGGITPERIAGLIRAGAHGAAVLSGVWRSTDPVASAVRYAAALNAVYSMNAEPESEPEARPDRRARRPGRGRATQEPIG